MPHATMNIRDSKHSTILAPYIGKYPHLRACLFQVYDDLVNAQKWNDITIHDLNRSSRVAYKGSPAGSTNERIIIPCLLEESLSLNWMSDLFTELQHPCNIYLAIVHGDSSIVYYRIGEGLVKPPN